MNKQLIKEVPSRIREESVVDSIFEKKKERNEMTSTEPITIEDYCFKHVLPIKKHILFRGNLTSTIRNELESAIQNRIINQMYINSFSASFNKYEHWGNQNEIFLNCYIKANVTKFVVGNIVSGELIFKNKVPCIINDKVCVTITNCINMISSETKITNIVISDEHGESKNIEADNQPKRAMITSIFGSDGLYELDCTGIIVL